MKIRAQFSNSIIEYIGSREFKPNLPHCREASNSLITTIHKGSSTGPIVLVSLSPALVDIIFIS